MINITHWLTCLFCSCTTSSNNDFLYVLHYEGRRGGTVVQRLVLSSTSPCPCQLFTRLRAFLPYMLTDVNGGRVDIKGRNRCSDAGIMRPQHRPFPLLCYVSKVSKSSLSIALVDLIRNGEYGKNLCSNKNLIHLQNVSISLYWFLCFHSHFFVFCLRYFRSSMSNNKRNVKASLLLRW